MKTAAYMIDHYKFMTSIGMLNEVMWQYINMACGGDGGKLFGIEGEPSCREYNYPDYPDSFFQEVCDGMRWNYLIDEHES
jgi:hypothetical protein